ncbi:VOC family protein [bacterium]|nr:VOC family protein [bacterium]
MHTFCHIELTTTDLEKAANFYREMFGWKVDPMMDNYWMITTNDDPQGVSGGLIKVDNVLDSGAQNYVFVDDVADALKKAVSLGAKVIDEKRPLPHEMGFIGMFELSDGFKLGLFSRK